MPDPQQPKRHDPPSRPVDGSINTAVKLVNADPERQYIKANPNDEWAGVQAMKELGFVVETHRKDGPRLIGGDTAKDGDALTQHGQVWMSRPIAMQRAAEEHARQVAFQRFQAMGKPGGIDNVKGATGKLANVSITS